jgi:ABC-2 type transport system permease protein
MQFIQTIYTIWQREIIRYWRDKTRIVSTFFMPLMFLVIFGAGLNETLATGNFGVDFTQFMYPGIIAMSIMNIAFFSTISTVWDREFGSWDKMLISIIIMVLILLT